MAIDAICPFFRYEKNKITFCECADIHPPDAEARREIVYNYCAHAENYKQCQFYKVMEHYYERKLK